MAARFTRIAFAFVIAIAIAGCSENGVSSSYSVAHSRAPVPDPAHLLSIWPNPTIERSHDFLANPGATGTFIYECSENVNTCRWYRKGHNVVAGTITSGLSRPFNIGVGPTFGYIYIANADASNVLEYPPNSSSLYRKFNDAGEFPIDVAVDSQQNVYVANASTTSSGPGSVTIFNKSGGLIRTLHDPRVSTGVSISVDESHNVVFCFFNTSGGNECDNFPNAKGKGNLDLAYYFDSLAGSSVDNAEHIVLIDPVAKVAVTYKGASNCGVMTLGSAAEPYMMALDRSNATLYVSDLGSASLIAYPFSDCRNGVANPSFAYNAGIGSSEEVSGVAITPGVVP
jgi:hypothetical protein